MNPMRNIRIGKVTMNIGAGKDQTKLENSMKLLKNVSGMSPIKTITKKRIPTWGLRPGLPIGCKVTLRKEPASKMLKRLLDAKDNVLKPKQFDENGNVSFGIAEYIDIPDTKYDPDIGILGLEVCVTLERPGFRIKRRKIQKRKVGPKHTITKDDAIAFMKKTFNVNVEEAE